jgi:hypothetical protein
MMTDDVVITGQIVTHISKKDVHDIMPFSEFAALTDAVFDFPEGTMLTEKQRLDEQLAALEALRKQVVTLERDSGIQTLLGFCDVLTDGCVERLRGLVVNMMSNFDNDFDLHSRIILELLDAFLLDITEESENLSNLRKRINHWKTNLTAQRKILK